MGRKPGERNWEDAEGDYTLHLPPPKTFEYPQEQDNKKRIGDIVMVYGREFIIAVDGRLELVD